MGKKQAKNALANVPRMARLVRVKAERGYGNGLYEIVASTTHEYTLRPYKREGENIQIFKAHTVKVSAEEARVYFKAYLGRA